MDSRHYNETLFARAQFFRLYQCMRKVKLFNASSIEKLELQINDWLAANKTVDIIETNVTSLLSANLLKSPKGERYVFYIFYRANDAVAEAQQLVAAEQEIPVVIKPTDLGTVN